MSGDRKTVSATDETLEAPVSGTDETVTPTSGAGDTLGATGGGTTRPNAELHNLSPGDVIERYEIKAVLGAGGMGRVYRALDPDLHRELAIKVLRRTGSNLEHRLLREAQAMARLKHANLATVYDVGTVRGQVFIAFEFIDGQTLAAWAKSASRTIDERLAALSAAGRGLAAAHAAGVIHRDFKPDNVLVARDGDVKVVDFGLARGVDSEPEEAGETMPAAPAGDALAKDLTVTGSLLGTPAYMAPEQHKGLHSDARADQFGFAVSAWEVLYGQRPFRGDSLESLARAICAGTIEAPPASNVPSHVEMVLRRALSTDPASRYRDMTELLSALAQPGAAKPSPATRRRLIGAALGLVAIGGGLAVMKGGKHESSQATTDGDVDKQEIRGVIKKNIAGVSDCYQNAFDADPSLGAGQVKIDFEIAPTGRVVSTRIVNDDFKGKGGVGACIAAKSFDWQFPPPTGGGSAHVTYPFEFRPAIVANIPDAAVAEDDGRVHVVIGDFGGDAMTDEIRATSRPKVAELLGKLAPDLSVDITPGPVDAQAGAHHRAFVFDVDLTKLDVTGDKVITCMIKATLQTYPDKGVAAVATSKATAELDTSALKEIAAGGADCINASLEMLVTKQILPGLRKQAGSAQ